MTKFCLKYIETFFLLAFFSILTLTLLVQPAFADRIINSVTLNGSSSVIVAPSAAITASINVTTNTLNDKNWRGTSWNISGSNCVNHADHNGAGTYSENFTVTAPSSPGTYNISFSAYADNACSADPSPVYTLTGGITVAVATPTPTATPTPGSTPTPTPTPTPGSTPTPTPTPVPGVPTPTPTPATSTSPSSSVTYYPSVAIAVFAPNPTNKVPLTFSGTASLEQGIIAIVEYTLTEGASWTRAQPADGNFNGKDEHFTFTTPNLAEGKYTVKVRAKSEAGVFTQDSAYATQVVTIATTPPLVTLDKITQNPTKNQTPTLKGTATAKLVDITKVEISIDDGKSWQTAKRIGNKFSLALAVLEDGNYRVSARAFDRAGNTGRSDTQILIIDTIPPIIGGAMQSLGPQILTPDKNGAISIVSGAQTTIAMSMKGGVIDAEIFTSSGSFKLRPKEGTNLWVGMIKLDSVGVKPLTVLAIDGAGNSTERTYNTLMVENSGLVSDKKTKQVVERAVVSVHYFENVSSQWILWEANSYGQQNPQKTDRNGNYSFMLPPGKYYMEVKAPGYNSLQSEIVTVTKTSIFNDMLILNPKPKIEFSLPFFGKVILSLPTLTPPESFSFKKSNQEPEVVLISGELKPGTPSPDFSLPAVALAKGGLPNLDNKLVSLGNYKGRKLLLSFITPWSSLSLEQAQFLSDAYLKLAENQAMLVVSLQESVATTQTMIEKGKYKFPVVADKDGVTAVQYNITILPHHVFIDGNGTIQETFTGVLTKEELIKKFENL